MKSLEEALNKDLPSPQELHEKEEATKYVAKYLINFDLHIDRYAFLNSWPQIRSDKKIRTTKNPAKILRQFQ